MSSLTPILCSMIGSNDINNSLSSSFPRTFSQKYIFYQLFSLQAKHYYQLNLRFKIQSLTRRGIPLPSPTLIMPSFSASSLPRRLYTLFPPDPHKTCQVDVFLATLFDPTFLQPLSISISPTEWVYIQRDQKKCDASSFQYTDQQLWFSVLWYTASEGFYTIFHATAVSHYQ